MEQLIPESYQAYLDRFKTEVTQLCSKWKGNQSDTHVFAYEETGSIGYAWEEPSARKN